MIPSLDYGKPPDDMEIAKYCPIRPPVEIKIGNLWAQGNIYICDSSKQTITPNKYCRFTSYNMRPWQVRHPLCWLLSVDQSKIPPPPTSMILVPNHNNQICATHSVGLNASLQLPIDFNCEWFCMIYYFHGHCNDSYMHKAW